MKCPVDQADLLMTERHGVEIDYCPTCRGVWLDRGELDKIIDRAADAGPSRPATRVTSTAPTRNERDTPQGGLLERASDLVRDRDDDDRRNHPRKKKRGSFLEDLFDF
jgi:hypothetical protein